MFVKQILHLHPEVNRYNILTCFRTGEGLLLLQDYNRIYFVDTK